MSSGPAWPTGTVTFLFTDIEGSTRRWEDRPDMGGLVAEHFELLEAAVERHGGVVFSRMGDGLAAAFASAPAAARAALDAQLGLVGSELAARMGLHTGEAAPTGEDYLGRPVNRAARVMAVGHGGQILVSGATARLLDGHLPDGAVLVDLGQHRLRDLAQPEHLHQLGHPALPSAFARLRSLDAYPGNLPAQRSVLVGRRADLIRLRKLLESRRLVTLTGTGGVGKTRLALHAAADALEVFPGGAWLVELARTTDPAATAAVAAAALGAATAGRSELDAVIDHLGASRTVVVLDNCEHVLDTAAELAGVILDRCPNVTILATSREPLDLDGEQAVPLAPLSPDDAPALFTERARDADPDLELGDEDAIAEICRRLDGIPLALELAAARVATMPVTDIVAALDDRFRLLTRSRRRTTSRHQTLRSALEWSYQLLTEPEQRLLRTLGVFAGGFTREALAVVAPGPDLDDDLASLVRKKLVHLDRGTRRYRLLETVRAYALEQLAAHDETHTARRAHAEWMVSLVDHPMEDLLDIDAALLRPMKAELDNWREAVGYALLCGDGHLARRLCVTVQGADIPETARWAEAALPLAEADRVPARHWLNYTAAVHAASVMDATALRHHISAFEAGAVDAVERAWIANLRAVEATSRGDDPLEPLTQALALDGLSPRQRAMLTAFVSLYRNLPPATDIGAARTAVDLCADVRSSALPAAQAFLAMALRDEDPDQALRLLDDALRTGRDLGDSFALATVVGFGAIALLSADVGRAVPHLRAQLQDLQPFWNVNAAAALTACLAVLHRERAPFAATLHSQLQAQPGFYSYIPSLVPELAAVPVEPVAPLDLAELIEQTDAALAALLPPSEA